MIIYPTLKFERLMIPFVLFRGDDVVAHLLFTVQHLFAGSQDPIDHMFDALFQISHFLNIIQTNK